MDAILNRTSNNGYCNGKSVNRLSELASAGFTNVQAYDYWSSTTYVGYTSYAWDVTMYDGCMYYDDESSPRYVWPVRSGH
ncbi:MAG: DUF1566 domain-containing protein [Nitrospirae bacterium]|nr:DUF1566 domain-containing protein [Nitrospirota bacterium]